MDPRSQRTRIFFAIAALWNISAASVALLAPELHTEMFYGADADLSGPLGQMSSATAWVSVLLFGVGYAMVARDPTKNHGIVWLGGAGKLYVSALWTWAFIEGHGTTLILVGAIGDLVFAGLFAWFLYARRGAGSPGVIVRRAATDRRCHR